MVSILVTTYALVFGAELVGDKTFYTIGALATRYRLSPIFCGSSLAFMCKMLAAVLLGQAIAHLPSGIVTTLSCATFFTMALVIWFKKPEAENLEIDPRRSWIRIAAASFAGIFFSEWGDVGQIAAATLSARYGKLELVWLGAVLAMMTKGILAITLGAGLRSRVPRNALRYGTFGLCLAMGFMALLRIDL